MSLDYGLGPLEGYLLEQTDYLKYYMSCGGSDSAGQNLDKATAQ